MLPLFSNQKVALPLHQQLAAQGGQGAGPQGLVVALSSARLPRQVDAQVLCCVRV